MNPVRIAVIGAGVMGRQHVRYLQADPDCRLAAVVDPDPAAAVLAREHGADHFRTPGELLAAEPVDGAIVAAPTALHEEIGLQCVAARVPTLVEKPICASLEAAERLNRTAEEGGVPLLVGHHRRYNPAVAETVRLLTDGTLGRLVAVSGIWCVRKPDDYFLPDWRRAPGGGPVLTNLIHEIDLLRCLGGEIVAVGGCTSSAVRGFATEDSAALHLNFAGGAVGAMVLSDAAVSPWSWEQASGENPVRFFENDQNPYRFFGTEAALEFPRLTLWRHDGPASWSRPIAASEIAVPRADVFTLQIAHFARVIRGQEKPRVSGREGQRTLAATLALFEAARSGRTVVMERSGWPAEARRAGAPA